MYRGKGELVVRPKALVDEDVLRTVREGKVVAGSGSQQACT